MTARELSADCASCFGLCCVALPLTASADFAIDKDAGTPCRHLREDFGCGIHARLRERGFPGCTAYDCFGAGQHVAQHTYGGVSWRDAPETAAQMVDVFPVVRQLHEMLVHLAEAQARTAALGHPAGTARADAAALRADLEAAVVEAGRLADLDPGGLLALDVGAHRRGVAPLLGRASALLRAGTGPGRPHPRARPGADLVGARLARADLRGADLRGAYLIGADLAGADLRTADLLGADLRGAEMSVADLSGALFLTQPQVAAARGDGATRLPPHLARPAHWR